MINELPAGWAWMTVESVGEVQLGRQRSPKHHQGAHMRPYLRVANVFEDRIDLSDVKEMNFTPQEFETYRLEYGDILLNEGQSLELVGRPAMFRGEVEGCCFQNTLVRFRAGEGIDRAFALHYFRHCLHSGIFQSIAGQTTSIAHLGARRFAEMQMPIPPLNEQRRIVAKIEELLSDLDAGVKALEDAQDQLKRYRQSVLKSAVEGTLTQAWRETHAGDVEPASALLERILKERRERWEAEQLAKYEAKGQTPPKGWEKRYKEPQQPDTSDLPELPDGWVWASVDQVLVQGLTNGRSVSTLEGGFPVLRLTCLKSGRVDLTERKDGAWSADEAKSYLVERGDFFVSRGSGSLGFVGRGGLVTDEPDGVAYPDTLIRIRANEEGLLPRFLRVLWDSALVRRQIESAARTTAGIYKVNQQDLQALCIPLPPVREQEVIADEAERFLSAKEATDAAVMLELPRAEHLRQSILKRAFEGKLVPQDPSEEPAEKLLERIRGGQSSTRRKRRVVAEGEDQLLLNL